MTPFLKQSAVWATGSKPNQFRQARIRLTLFYTAVFGVFLIAFSFALYFSFNQRIQVDLDRDTTTELRQRAILIESLDRLQDSIKWIDLGSLFVVGCFSWYVAGKSLEPISQSLRARERFMADASHELRTPLTVLQTGLEVFERKKNPSANDARKLAVDSLDEVRRMDRLVTDLRTLARLDSGPPTMPSEPFDFSIALERSASALRAYAAQRSITIKVESTADVLVLADPYQLEQICTNLLKNAVDYSPDGAAVQASVRIESRAVLRISDSGAGIAHSDLPHVFERFWRAEQSRSRRTGGSGLGLAIVRDLAEGMGGSVSVTSTLGKGSEFSVHLPLFRHSR